MRPYQLRGQRKTGDATFKSSESDLNETLSPQWNIMLTCLRGNTNTVLTLKYTQISSNKKSTFELANWTLTGLQNFKLGFEKKPCMALTLLLFFFKLLITWLILVCSWSGRLYCNCVMFVYSASEYSRFYFFLCHLSGLTVWILPSCCVACLLVGGPKINKHTKPVRWIIYKFQMYFFLTHHHLNSFLSFLSSVYLFRQNLYRSNLSFFFFFGWLTIFSLNKEGWISYVFLNLASKLQKKKKVGAIDQYTLKKLQYCVWESAMKKKTPNKQRSRARLTAVLR